MPVCVYAHWNQIDYANERKTMLLSGKCSQTNMFEIQIWNENKNTVKNINIKAKKKKKQKNKTKLNIYFSKKHKSG